MTSGGKEKWIALLRGIMEESRTRANFSDINKLMGKLGIKGDDGDRMLTQFTGHHKKMGPTKKRTVYSDQRTDYGQKITVIHDQTSNGMPSIRDFFIGLAEHELGGKENTLDNKITVLQARIEKHYSHDYPDEVGEEQQSNSANSSISLR